MKHIRSANLWFFMLLLLFPLQGRAVDLSNTTPDRMNGLQLEMSYFEDASASLSITEILSGNGRFSPVTEATQNFGFSQSAIWFKIDLAGAQRDQDDWILEVAFPLLDAIDFYSTSDSRMLKTLWSGDNYPFGQRTIKNRFFTFPVNFDEKNDDLTIYLKVSTSSSFQVPVNLWRPEAFYQSDHNEQILLGLYYGFLLALFLYNLMIARAVRESVYFYFCAYVATYCFFQLAVNGLGFEYFWPSMTYWNGRSALVFLTCCMGFSMLFSRSFLRINSFNFPTLNRFYLGIVTLHIPLFVVVFFADYLLSIKFLTLIAAVGGTLLLVSGVTVLIRKGDTAKFYLLAWSFFLIGVAVFALKTWGLIPKNFFTEYALQIGAASEMFLLSYALADRFNRVRDDNVRIQREATLLLEQRVDARTGELQEAMDKLSDVNESLEKLSSRDSLTGIYNRTYFSEKYDYIWNSAIRTGNQVAILMIDLDHFKTINDNFGHVIGDEVIIGVVKRIKDVLPRSTDLFARYGGEEFIVALPYTDEKGAIRMGERIQKAVSKRVIETTDSNIGVTVSVGIASLAPEDFRHSQNLMLIERADKALYLAKREGRNCVRSWSLLESESLAAKTPSNSKGADDEQDAA